MVLADPAKSGRSPDKPKSWRKLQVWVLAKITRLGPCKNYEFCSWRKLRDLVLAKITNFAPGENYGIWSWRKLRDLVLAKITEYCPGRTAAPSVVLKMKFSLEASLNCKDLLHREIRNCKLRFMVLAKEILESATRWCRLYLYRLVEVHQSLFVSFLVLF